MSEKSTHPLDFHDHGGDGFDRAVGVVIKSAEDASMEVDVCREWSEAGRRGVPGSRVDCDFHLLAILIPV